MFRKVVPGYGAPMRRHEASSHCSRLLGTLLPVALWGCQGPAPDTGPPWPPRSADPAPSQAEEPDLTPVARRVSEHLALGHAVPSLSDIRAEVGESVPPPSPSGYDFEVPDTIRVWLSSEGGDYSCDGPILVLDFEDYVKGVLPSEWISSWEDESLRTGAVAIRTYAAWWVNAGGKYDCADICDTTSCQVYGDTRLSVTNAAVDDTEGEYAVYGSELIFAQYSAENGDPTADGVSEPYCAGEEVFGHGHGVCQWGTQRWALYEGRDHTWMIEHYYPGGRVVVANGDGDGDGWAESDGDCDDTRPDVNPGAEERCNGRDDDCDGTVDEPDAVDASTFWRDADGDGFGDPASPTRACSRPDGTVTNDDDCDDTNARSWPGAPELCDLGDNDCDGATDEGYDADGDGWRTCQGDCADGNAAIHPEEPEILDGLDNDCDLRVDEGTVLYDDDGDGWTDAAGDCDDADPWAFPGAPESADDGDDDCDGETDEGTAPVDDDGDGYVGSEDCDDGAPSIHPLAPESPNGLDDDCDGRVDEGTSAADDDGDGWSEAQGDCDDADAATWPGAPEEPNGRDDDCDGITDDQTPTFDDDGDGFAEVAGDCDDADPTRHPQAPEVPDLLDQDCDGRVDEGTSAVDDDGDSFTEDEGDCDDGRPLIWPGAPEEPNGQDDDCDGAVDEGTVLRDDDGDTWTEAMGDCDDADAATWPGAPEAPNGRDDDCDGTTDDQTPLFDDDGDGFTEAAGDCDDASPTVHPGAPELLDGRDTDCDGQAEAPQGWLAGCNTVSPRGSWALGLCGLLAGLARARRSPGSGRQVRASRP